MVRPTKITIAILTLCWRRPPVGVVRRRKKIMNHKLTAAC